MLGKWWPTELSLFKVCDYCEKSSYANDHLLRFQLFDFQILARGEQICVDQGENYCPQTVLLVLKANDANDLDQGLSDRWISGEVRSLPWRKNKLHNLFEFPVGVVHRIRGTVKVCPKKSRDGLQANWSSGSVLELWLQW